MPRRSPRVAAAAVLLTAAALVGVLTLPADRGGAELSAIFESANGLITGGQVRAGGLPIGRITNVDLDRGGYPRVSFRVDDGYVVKQGATADIRLLSQAGQLNRFIDIKNGRGPALSDGSTLGLALTDQPVEIDDFLSALTPKVRREVRGLVGRAAQTFAGQGPTMDRALAHSGQALTQVAGLLGDATADRGALRTIVARTGDLVAQLASGPAALGTTVDRAAQLLATTAGRQRELATTLDALPGALQAPRAALRRFSAVAPRLTDTVRRVDSATRPLDPLAQELRRTATAAPETFAEARGLVTALTKNGPTLRRLVATALPATRQLTPAVGGLNPILDQFRARGADAFGWIPLLGDSTANYDAVGHGARLMGLLTEPPRRLTAGPADCSAGLLRRPFDRAPGTLACDAWPDYVKSFSGGGLDPLTQVTPDDTASRDRGIK